MAVIDLFALTEALPRGSRLIGVDLGTKTIGLALSDVMWTIASPLETIRRVKFTPDVAQLLAIAERHGAGALVFGLPKNLDGTEGPRAQSTRAFFQSFEGNPFDYICEEDEGAHTWEYWDEHIQHFLKYIG